VRYNVETVEEETNMDVRPAEVPDTKHEAHPHASKRVIIGVVAVVAVFVLGGIIWSHWGERIEEICFGDKEACSPPYGEELLNEPPQYDPSVFNDMN